MSTTAKNSLTAQNKETTVVEKKPKTIFDVTSWSKAICDSATKTY